MAARICRSTARERQKRSTLRTSDIDAINSFQTCDQQRNSDRGAASQSAARRQRSRPSGATANDKRTAYRRSAEPTRVVSARWHSHSLL